MHPQHDVVVRPGTLGHVSNLAVSQPVVELAERLKALTGMGYKATNATKQALIEGLDSVEEMTGGSVVKLAQRTGKSVAYQMNSTIARQLLKSLKPR